MSLFSFFIELCCSQGLVETRTRSFSSAKGPLFMLSIGGECRCIPNKRKQGDGYGPTGSGDTF